MSENVKQSKLAKNWAAFIRNLKDIRLELKKVVWPTKEQLINNTVSVLAACLLIGILIWVIDFGLSSILNLIFSR
jgi:preprotein translocase subunit SecE